MSSPLHQPAPLQVAHNVPLFLARHGETAWNREERWQGQTDIGLNERGRAQAAALAERLTGLGIRHITASDLSRARETAEIVARRLGIAEVLIDADLRERGYGVFEGLTREQCEVQHPDDWGRYLADRTHTPTRAELQEQVIARMRAAVARAAARGAAAGDPVLIVGHGGSIRALLHADTGVRPPPMDNAATIRALFSATGLRDPALL